MKRRIAPRRLILALTAAMLVIAAGEASAQRRAAPARAPRPAHEGRIDLTAMYGHMWGGNISTSMWGGSKFRLGTAPSMFFALNYPLADTFWLELSYGHQGGELDLDRNGQPTSTLCDLSIDYWQIGTVRGMPVGQGNIIPYVAGTLGVTYYNPGSDSFEVDGTEYYLDSATKFSLTLGVGVKAFFGADERFGLRASFKTMPTLYNTGAGLWFGSGGASVSVSGNAVWQWEVAGGVTVRLG